MYHNCYVVSDQRRVRTTLLLDEVVARREARAARHGKRDSEVIEESLRRDLGLELLERRWSQDRLSEEQAMHLALEALHSTGSRHHG